MSAQKKAPGKAASQGGKGHYTFPGAIGLVRRTADSGRQRGQSGCRSSCLEALGEGLHAFARTPRGPQECPREHPQVQTPPRGTTVAYPLRRYSPGGLMSNSRGRENRSFSKACQRQKNAASTNKPKDKPDGMLERESRSCRADGAKRPSAGSVGSLREGLKTFGPPCLTWLVDWVPGPPCRLCAIWGECVRFCYRRQIERQRRDPRVW